MARGDRHAGLARNRLGSCPFLARPVPRVTCFAGPMRPRRVRMEVVVHRNKIGVGSKEEPVMDAPITIFLFTPIFLFLVGTPALIWLLRKH